jgi:hypothetical protein
MLLCQVATPLRNELAATTAKTLRKRRSSAGATKENGVMRIEGADEEEPDWTATTQRTASGAFSSCCRVRVAASAN